MGGTHTHALTMSGEMADIFANRHEGVTAIVRFMRERFSTADLLVYAGADGFISPDRASDFAASIASANWRVSAEVVAQLRSAAFFIDIGSTTTDLTLIHDHRVDARGNDDFDRLACGELIYSGVVRTPLMATARQAPFAGDWIPLMAEQFATAADVYRLTGQLPEDTDQHPAADSGEKTVEASARRLARMIGRDVQSATLPAWKRLALYFANVQLATLQAACERLLSRDLLEPDAPVIGAGIGRFVVERLAQRLSRPYQEFTDLFAASAVDKQWLAACAPAVAVAYLATNRYVDR
jgi:(4-(4-[2-(gamma-L-glutamylamino)ethyl]phenoxymethyl)furan-2-yl)methanamine synthase